MLHAPSQKPQIKVAKRLDILSQDRNKTKLKAIIKESEGAVGEVTRSDLLFEVGKEAIDVKAKAQPKPKVGDGEIKPNMFFLRQNFGAITNQDDVRSFILINKVITSPFGHIAEYAENTRNGIYNENHPDWASRSQDRRFHDMLGIGDFVIITFTKQRNCIIARVVSEPYNDYKSGLFTSFVNDEIRIGQVGDTPFNPVIRHIEIIRTDVILRDMRILPRNTFGRISKAESLDEILSWII